MARNLKAEPLLPTDDVQGDILPGLAKRSELLLFFSIVDVAKFRRLLDDLPVTSLQECLDQRDAIAAAQDASSETLIATPGLNVALTFAGLEKLGVPGLAHPPQGTDPSYDAFKAGMGARTTVLNDPPPAQWKILQPDPHLHGVFVVTGSSAAEAADVVALRLSPPADNGWSLLHEEVGTVRPEPVRGHEHFGYADGVSQPGVRGRIAPDAPLTPSALDNPDQGQPGQDLLWPGLFLFGYPSQDATAKNLTVKGPVRQPPLPFMANGAYLVMRRLAQLVPEFDQSVKAAARTTGGASDAVTPEQLGAQLVGRWKSGAPIIKAPAADDPTLADGTEHVNDFEFGDDREGILCPWAAHVRKAYPRDDVFHNVDPTEEQADAAEAATQTHRMMRRGIAFGPELTTAEAVAGQSDPNAERGLLFLCYVTALTDQFEFVQQSWVDAPAFSQPGAGVDAIIGQAAGTPSPFLGAAATSLDPARKPQLSFAHFVHMQGGQYFFAPSISALRAL